MTRKLN